MNTKLRTSTFIKTAGAVTALALTVPAHADALTDLVATIDFASVITGVMAIASALLALYLAMKGADIIIKKVKGG